ncbi:MAG: hypothetical protein AB7Q29_15565, partial [Vicinamibacterales bacterium]
MTETTWTPSKLWRRMTAEQRLRAAAAFWADEQASDDQIQAVLLIAQQRKFRPKSVLALSADRRSRHLAAIVNLPDALAARALVVYHLAGQREMMCTFLDALDLKHENGLIEDDDATPDAGKIGPAVEALSAAYPAEDVSLYLTTLVCQDPET